MRIKAVLLALMASVCVLTPTALADEAVRFEPSSTTVNNIGGCDGAAAQSAVCKDINKQGNPLFGPDGVLTKIANIFALIVGIISVFMLILSGLRYVLSAGDASKTASARSGIIYAAVGVVVASIARFIVGLILAKL